MITAYQLADLVLFQELNHPFYQMGKDGWIYTREWDPVDFQHLDADDAYIEAFSDFLSNIQNYCANHGMGFCFFLAPNKESIYPEYYPDGYGIKEQPNRSDRMILSLRAQNVNYVDSRQALLREKRNALVCNRKEDAGHWNMHGALAGVQALYRDFLMKEYPQAGMLEKSELQSGEQEVKFLLNSFLKINEKVPVYSSALQNIEDISQKAFLKFDSSGQYRGQWINKNLLDSPKIMIFGDSYFSNVSCFFTGHFSETTLLHITYMKDFYKYIEEFRPDVIVIEAVERVIDADVWPEEWFRWKEEYFETYLETR